MICRVLHVARCVICGGCQSSIQTALLGRVVVIQLSLVDHPFSELRERILLGLVLLSTSGHILDVFVVNIDLGFLVVHVW
jgi:hypothetical protein